MYKIPLKKYPKRKKDAITKQILEDVSLRSLNTFFNLRTINDLEMYHKNDGFTTNVKL